MDTRYGRYRLSASHLPAGLIGRDEALIVAALRLDPALPTARRPSPLDGDSLRREAQIALALASGRTDASIALTLGIVSPHTIRHHAEHIFSKLGIHSRKAIRAFACWKPSIVA